MSNLLRRRSAAFDLGLHCFPMSIVLTLRIIIALKSSTSRLLLAVH